MALRFLVASTVAVAALVAPATSASASTAAVDMAITESGSPIADGSTLNDTSTVTVGTSALLTPGLGQRELRTDLDTGTVYAAGSAVAPEGWAIQYSTNGTDWLTSEPATASTVRSVRATATAAAGAIDGRSQVYSSETNASIPSSTFGASTGGDGWDAFFDDNNVYNIFHHEGSFLRLDCHVRATGERCATSDPTKAYPRVFTGYVGPGMSSGWVDPVTGKLYAMTVSQAAGKAGVLCVTVTSAAGPDSCGFIALSDTASAYTWSYIGGTTTLGRRMFAVDAYTKQLLCFDAETNARCASSPISMSDATQSSFGGNGGNGPGNRVTSDGQRLWVKTPSVLRCFNADLTACSNAFPKTIESNSDLPIAVHQTSTGVADGLCFFSTAAETPWAQSCVNLAGAFVSTWKSPFNVANSAAANDSNNENWWFDGTSTLGRYYWTSIGMETVTCYDFATNTACSGYTNIRFGGFGLVYAVRVDPQNPRCLWVNSDAGLIRNFDAVTGTAGCAGNPVITLQPSQFAPRYACSTTAGISQWTTLRLLALLGGGSATGVTLTVRNSLGQVVTGWAAVPVSLNQPLDMTGLDVALSGSRPTFSFAFSGVSGTLTTATIALDYKGAGPELCVRATLSGANASDTSGTCPAVTVNGSMTDSGGTFTTSRSLRVATSGGSCAQNIVRQTVPGAVTGLTGTGLNTAATLRFTPPADTGGLPLLGFEISRNGGASWVDAAAIDNGDGTFSAAQNGLTAGSTYTFLVAAVNNLGRGPTASIGITAQRVSVDALTDVVLSAGTVTLETQTATGLPLTYTVTPSSVCTVASNIITLVAVGTCTVTANQAGDANATPVILPAETTGSFAVLPVPATVPGTVRNLAVVANSGQLELVWTAPANDGGAAIRDYQIQYKTAGTWIPYVDGVTAATGAVLTGLTNGTVYDLRVAAVNSAGQGAWAATVSGTPRTVPGAVTNLSVSRAAGATSAALTFTAPANNGGSVLTDYVVEVKDNQTTTWTAFSDAVSTATSITVTGLDTDKGYDFRVAAKNAAGNGAWTSTATLQAASTDGALSLTWTTPLTGGETLLHYVPQYRAAGASTWLDAASTTNTTFTLSGLTNGTEYEVRVAALTTSSTSSYTSLITGTPVTAPGVARNVSLTPGDRQLAVTWWAPLNNGGSAITDYVVSYRVAGSDGSWTPLNDGVSSLRSAVVTGLTNGTAYEVRVAAVNGQGAGATSTPVNATPRTLASAPATGTAVGGLGLVNVSWTAPLSDGGSPVTGYTVQYKTASAGTWTTHASAVEGTSTSITGLAAGTAYGVRVAAVTAAGLGAFTSTVSASTTVTATAGCSTGALSFSTGARRRGDVAVTDPTRCYQRTATLGVDNSGRPIPAKLTIPGNSVAAAANFNIEVMSDTSTIAAGLPAVTITAATTANAASVTTFDEPLEIELTGLSTALPAVSTDGGVTWRTLVQRTSAEVKAMGAAGDGYALSGNTFTIYTMHLTSFALLDGTQPAGSGRDGTNTNDGDGGTNTDTGGAEAYVPVNPMVPKSSPVMTWRAADGVLVCTSPAWWLPQYRIDVEWIGINAKPVSLKEAPWETTVTLGKGFTGTVGCNLTAFAENAVGTVGAALTIGPETPVVAPKTWTALKRAKLTFSSGTLTLSTVHARQLRSVAKTAKTLISVAATAAGRSTDARNRAQLRLALAERALRTAGYTGRIVTKVITSSPKALQTVKLTYR